MLNQRNHLKILVGMCYRLIYILLPFLLMNKLYFDKGKLIVLAIVFLSWYYDSFCYIFGNLLGKRKLFERISPKKSVEGLLGGSIMVLVMVYFYPVILEWIAKAIPTFNLYSQPISSAQWMFLGVLSIFSATYGDLVESMFKRSIGVKDSGSVLPGHGGFLDRMDAILINIAFMAFGILGSRTMERNIGVVKLFRIKTGDCSMKGLYS
jgi:phosphatidate cytidylyltransferase